LFLQAQQDDSTTLGDDALIDLVISFALAGRDTTASLLTWTTFFLTQNPEIQQTLRAEVSKFEHEDISYQDIEEMPYLRAILWETLRLRPVVPLDSKTAQKADVLPDGTHVPRNARVFFFPYGVGLDAERWGDDVAIFRPERWVGKPLPSSFDFPAFQAGPRICTGMNMALFEAGVMLATLVRCFHLELATPAQNIVHDRNIVMGVKDSLPVRAIPLSCSNSVSHLGGS
jgi:cytochrome P450